MEHIWAPWRIEYIDREKGGGCFLCEKAKQNRDEENCVLFRGTWNYILLNMFPYNPAHLLVAPYRHVAKLDDMTSEERHEHFDIVSRSITILREVFKPGGFNVGINIGAVAGAGVDDHIHTHIVPRWHGDTNFMTVVSNVRVIPDALASTYGKLKGKFQAMSIS